jgi:hypothetical protein
MVRTYWLVPVFYEASGHLDLQPFARIDQIEACRPRAMSAADCTGCERVGRLHQSGTLLPWPSVSSTRS